MTPGSFTRSVRYTPCRSQVSSFCTLFYVGDTILGFASSSVILVAVAAALLVVRSLLGWQQRRFANRLFQQLPDVVELVTRTVKAGLPVRQRFRAGRRESRHV